jgi:hypothetical protein
LGIGQHPFYALVENTSGLQYARTRAASGMVTVLSKRYSPNLWTTLGYELNLYHGVPGFRLDDPTHKYAFTSTAPDLLQESYSWN